MKIVEALLGYLRMEVHHLSPLYLASPLLCSGSVEVIKPILEEIDTAVTGRGALVRDHIS